jgi:hypothetical protein
MESEKNQVIFFHGLESNSKSEKSEWLKKNYNAYCPAMDYTNPNLFRDMYNEVLKREPRILIGSSMGGWFAYCLSTLTGVRTLLLNPAVHSRSMEPKVSLGKTPSHHFVVLGKNDDIIDPNQSKTWFRKNGIGQIEFVMENIGHRTPVFVLQKHISSAINEDWSMESPGNVPDYSFLPEGLRDFAVPNPMASRPFQNMGVAMTVENQREIPEVIAHQRNLSEDEKAFALKASNSPVDIFYEWLVLRGERPKISDIRSIWSNQQALDLINKMKESAKRSRPYWISSDIEVISGTENNSYSYPSGHSILAWMIAKKLSKQYPHLQDGLYHLANRIAKSRVQSGVHFPSDIKPGSEIAEAMIAMGI